MSVEFILGILISAVLALVGLVWRTLGERVRDLEDTVGKQKETFNGKTPLIYAAATRLDDLEKRLDRIENSFVNWMQRVEDKIDAITNKA